MLTSLSLRLRILLFFALIAAGGIVIIAGALWASYARAGNAELLDDFFFAGMVAGFGLLALSAGIWLLFDENVARPIEALSTQMRAKAHAGGAGAIDTEAARYLGDLAPAAAAVTGQLGEQAMTTAEAVASATARLSSETERLRALLTDIPVAMALIGPSHQIVLYDGQAASVLAQVAHPRLHASLFDYLERGAVEKAYAELVRTGREVRCTARGADGAQDFDLRLKPLGGAEGYLLIFEDSHALIGPEAERPLIYDFDLLEAAPPSEVGHARLSDLTFVVFDTETTGLLPHKDEIVQIGAVRVLKGRIVEGEVIDTLVDPDMPIPPAATKVHRITDTMVQGAPKIAEAARAFHHFARDAVIVAHNAPFDMAFLRRHAARTGVTWDHPVLDTVLLSAVLWGATEVHTLDALCERLGVEIPEALRHTGLGDAHATAEVLCRMLPMLMARGLETFDQVVAETRRHGRLLEDLN